MINEYRSCYRIMSNFQDYFNRLLWVSALGIGFGWLVSSPRWCSRVQSFHPDAELEFPSPSAFRSVVCCNWSADGNRLLYVARGGDNNNCRLGLVDENEDSGWTTVDAIGEPVCAATLAPDGRHTLVATLSGNLNWTDLEAHQSAILIKSSGLAKLTTTAISGDQRRIAAADCDGQIFLGDPLSGMSSRLTPSGASAVADLSFSRNGDQLVCARTDGSISVWDLATSTLLWEFTGHQGLASAAQMLPDGKRVISTGFDGMVYLWDCTTGSEAWHRNIGTQGFLALAVADDGRKAAWGGINETVAVWNFELECVDLEIATPGRSIRHLEFSHDGTTLAVAGNCGVIRRFDLKTGAEMAGFDTGSKARSGIVAGPLHPQ